MEEVFNAHEERILELLIDKYQSVFIRLIDQLHTYNQTNKKQHEYKILSKALYDYLMICFAFCKYIMQTISTIFKKCHS